MPPRRSARVAAAAEQRAWAFPQLPQPLALRIFSLLPADQRLRCAEVSRGWRATVALPALWRRVDLSPASGVAQPVSRALLRAAVARAGAALTALDVSEAYIGLQDVCAILRAAGATAEVHVSEELPFATALTAAPELRELHAGVSCTTELGCAVLEARTALRLHTLALMSAPAAELPRALLLALADARQQPTLTRLKLCDVVVRMADAMDALAEAVCARRSLRQVSFDFCDLTPAAVPGIARMLREGALTKLEIRGTDEAFVDAAGAAALGEALRATSTLTSLTLQKFHLLGAPAAALLGALVGHRSLRTLDLTSTRFADPDAAGAALAAVIAADAPALKEFSTYTCNLGVEGVGAVLDALERNTHLGRLRIHFHNVPAGFIRGRLLPAVRANTGLHTIGISRMVGYNRDADEDDGEAINEAADIVLDR